MVIKTKTAQNRNDFVLFFIIDANPNNFQLLLNQSGPFRKQKSRNTPNELI